MRRKAAFILTAAMTVVFMFLRWFSDALSAVAVGPFTASDLVLGACLLTIAAVFALCFSKKVPLQPIAEGARGTVSGWLCTFCGAILTMSALLDLFCWVRYGQVPPPNEYILNNIDRIALIASLLFGILGGAFLVMQGFSWMSHTDDHHTLRSWLSLAPVLWMWFRLARYEISYASTIDISESFFDFAILIFASLFFLQLARAVSGVGASPKNGLLICALCTGFIALSGAPVTIAELAQDRPIGELLGAIVEVIIGVFAIGIAFIQAYPASEATTAEVADDTLAWTDPARDLPPMEPSFEIDRVLPQVDEDVIIPTAAPIEEIPVTVKEAPKAAVEPIPAPAPAPKKDETAQPLTIEDILTEIDSFE